MEDKIRKIVITGGAQGLGRRITEHLSRRGYRVIVLDIKPFSDIPSAYRKRIDRYYEVDLSDLMAVSKTIDRIIKKHGSIDVLINNAALRFFRDYMDFGEEDIQKYIAVNFTAPILMIKKILPVMIKKGYGRIINISSKGGFHGYRTGSMYSSTKGALIKFTEAFGMELNGNKGNVTVNVICPDSFSSLEGEKFCGYDQIVNSIVKHIDRILDSKINAAVIPVFLPKTIFVEILRYFKDALSLLRKG
jgi:3-oxoacyl-[acyl-carrier protein] reductase